MCTKMVRIERTARMAARVGVTQGTWRARVRREGKYASRTFRLKTLASEWVSETERPIDMGCALISKKVSAAKTIADLADLHIEDLLEVGKHICRSKCAVLEALKRELEATRMPNLDRSSIISCEKKRAKRGAGRVTLSVDLSYLHTILTHAVAVHGINVNTENLRLARIALSRLGLIGRSNERVRCPSDDDGHTGSNHL